MKKSILIILLTWVCIAAFWPANHYSVKTYAQTKAYTATQNSSDLCLQIVKSDNWKEKEAAFLQARKTYKEAETLLEYFAYNHVIQYINGAPLPKLEEGVPGVSYVTPEGFQFLEEAICEQNEEETNRLASKLADRLQEVNNRLLANRKIYDRDVLESARNGLIRLMGLGITGFDTPCLSDAHAESEVVWQSIGEEVLNYYANHSRNASTVQGFVVSGNELFQNADFESFNRADFLQKALLPLYKELVQAQKELGVEFYDEIDVLDIPVNRRSEQVFSPDFFNKLYYANINKTQYNKKQSGLGKLLFYDPILSGNNQRSCNSCHQAEFAFADGKVRATNFSQTDSLPRNTPHLIDAIYAKSFFWDARADEIGVQIEHVVENEHEFNSNYLDVIEKLNTCPDYVELFQEAYPFLQPNMQVSKHTINQSLAAYIADLSSFSSPFDAYMNGNENSISSEAKAGFNLFMGKGACGTCHFAPTFSGLVPPFYADTETEVLGIPAMGYPETQTHDTDLGRFDSGKMSNRAPHFKHSFKTPTVRNSDKTAPYMHNGSMADLSTVVDYYNQGGGIGLGFAVDNQTLPFDSLSLSQTEQQSIVAFMESLTDTVTFNSKPSQLPVSSNAKLNDRVVGGVY